MTNDEFSKWRKRMGYERTIDAANALGLAQNTVLAYGRDQPIPRYIALACAALAFGLPPVGTPEHTAEPA